MLRTQGNGMLERSQRQEEIEVLSGFPSILTGLRPVLHSSFHGIFFSYLNGKLVFLAFSNQHHQE
jgi:hypothetical protein